ncbi:MAG: hypothetical protein HYU77_16975 [Betaproteobacteria bacterium]|nr:hypothetical protein [Betaproteobacteria bacterium]
MFRRSLILSVLLFAGSAFCQSAEALQAAYRLAGAGAPGLALKRVEELQPQKTDEVQWADWEILRLNLLAQLGRNEEILARVEGLPAEAPSHLTRWALLLGARAALKAGNAPLARRQLARLLWQIGTLDEEYRLARELVIDSYLLEKRGREAYLAMLRYEQDFKPVPRELAQRFAQTLIFQGMEKEAGPWLAYLEDVHPVKLLARLKAGLVTPDAVVSQVRIAMKKGALPGHWQVLREAALRQNNTALKLEASEQLLNLNHLAEQGLSAATAAAELWEGYRQAAEALANQHQLLTGDDLSWLDLAYRLQPSSSSLGRALLASVSRHGAAPGLREQALSQLLVTLRGAGLARTAGRLLAATPHGAEASFSPETRHFLGAAAVEGGEAALGVRLWKELPPPQGVSADDWRLRLAALQIKAGQNGDGAETLRQAVAGKERVPVAIVQRVLDLAREIVQRNPPIAVGVLADLAPRVEPTQRREVLFSLGRAADLSNDPRRAADAFLQAATLVDVKATDPLARLARLQAASSLARAGLKEEARTQYQWLLQVTKDKAQQEAIRRELRHLP